LREVVLAGPGSPVALAGDGVSGVLAILANPRRVAVALDEAGHVDVRRRVLTRRGSPSSLDALHWAVVRAVIAWESPLLYGVDPMTAHVDWPAKAQQTLDAALEKTVDVYTADVSSAAVAGHPAQVLLDASVGAQLLVLGNRGHGAFTELLSGSVREHVITHATCPVLVMCHDSRAPAGSSL